jgi:hypothetical protein
VTVLESARVTRAVRAVGADHLLAVVSDVVASIYGGQKNWTALLKSGKCNAKSHILTDTTNIAYISEAVLSIDVTPWLLCSSWIAAVVVGSKTSLVCPKKGTLLKNQIY